MIADHTIWGSYLTGLHDRITTVTDQVHADAAANPHPTWDPRGVRATVSPDLAGDIGVWRAAHQIPDSDTRPTGPAQPGLAERRWQRTLTRRLAAGNDALIEWGDTITTAAPTSTVDPFRSVLAEKLAHISASGIDAARLLRTAAAEGVLPDDHPTAALWWRISRHLSPAVAQAHHTDHHDFDRPHDQLRDLIGVERANQLEQSPLWPALVTSLDKAIASRLAPPPPDQQLPTRHPHRRRLPSARVAHLTAPRPDPRPDRRNRSSNRHPARQSPARPHRRAAPHR